MMNKVHRNVGELFSVVTQDAQLFNASIRENIAYGKMGSDDAAILRAAKLAELELQEHFGMPGPDAAPSRVERFDWRAIE